MKAIIGLLRYDTDTAARVHRATDGQTPPQRIEVLYRAPGGAWFLRTSGSPWQPLSGDGGAGSEDTGAQALRALTVEEAVQWGLANMGKAKFEATFAAVLSPA